MALCRLHNFCIDVKDVIDEESKNKYKSDENDELHLQHLVALSNDMRDDGMIASEVVSLNEIGRPDGLLSRGDHFNDAQHNRQQAANDNCPMDKMLETVIRQHLSRPPVGGRTK